LSSTTKNLFEKRFLDFQKLLFSMDFWFLVTDQFSIFQTQHSNQL
jgi:hypothetical protein